MKKTSNVKVYLKENYAPYLKELERLMVLINERAREPAATFTLRELFDEAKLFLGADKYVRGNYWNYANKQLNMLVRYHVLLKEKSGGVNRYRVATGEELKAAYKKNKQIPDTHRVPAIFDRRYWDPAGRD